MNYKEALESQKGAQFFKSENNSIDFKHSIAEHFFYLGYREHKRQLEEAEKVIDFYSDHTHPDYNTKKAREYKAKYGEKE
jgi:hypothetical protein